MAAFAKLSPARSCDTPAAPSTPSTMTTPDTPLLDRSTWDGAHECVLLVRLSGCLALL
jgi:hypothetical protein